MHFVIALYASFIADDFHDKTSTLETSETRNS